MDLGLSIIFANLLVAFVILLYKRYDKLEQWAKDEPVLFIATALAFVAVASVLILVMWFSENASLILPIVGVASFAIPIVLSFEDKYNLGTRLDNGEVRKSIAIALTVVYIIMLGIFFVSNLPYLGKVTINETQNNSSETISLNLVDDNLILPLLIQPAMAKDSSETVILEMDDGETEKENNKTKTANPAIPSKAASEQTGGKGGNDPKIENNESKNELNLSLDFPQGIPNSALGDIYKNFLYVYVLIIGFYFGSRVFEDFAGVKMTKELKGFDPEDLLKKRFAMGDISEKDYNTRIKYLESIKEFAFLFDKGNNLIRIANTTANEVGIEDIYIDGIHIFDKNGKPLTGNKIDAKKHKDIEIDITGLSSKDDYLIQLTTDSGRVIEDYMVLTKLK